MANRDNLEEYLDSQMREQQYETQQMAEKIRAEFEGTYSTLRAYTRVGGTRFEGTYPTLRAYTRVGGTRFEGTYSILRAYTRVGVPGLKVRTPHCVNTTALGYPV